MRTAAADLVTILHDEGVSHLFVNPGMHTAPLREALADADAVGIPHPQPILCVHEHVALSAAHGHHLAGGGPQAVMVHLDGGRLKLGGAAENAQRDRVPVIVFCGDGAEWRSTYEKLPDAPPAIASEPGLLGVTGKWAADLSRAANPALLLR